MTSSENRPTIAVPTQTLQAIDAIPAELPHSWVMNHRYFTALTLVGGVPWMVPLLPAWDEPTLRAIFDRCDGVFLAGGVDLEPGSYGEPRRDVCGRTDADRDRVELAFARWALEEEKPLFGVCRGLQVLNVLAGGTLFQDIGADVPDAIRHDYMPNAGHARDYLAHAIEVADGTRLRSIYGAGEVRVNSMHHQAVARLGAGLRVSARSSDGLVEAAEVPGQPFAIAVQWHPEMLIERDAGTRRLFEAFIDAASEYRRARTLGIPG